MIAIVDYGMGNLRSVHKAFEAVGAQAAVTRDPRVIADASHVVLPGVGAFPDCMANLDRYGLIEPIRRAVTAGKPFLGICLGFQVLFTESEEFGRHEGLALVAGRVLRFPAGPPSGQTGEARPLKVPHMGWNSVHLTAPAPPLTGIPDEAYAYFVHSYYVVPEDAGIVSTRTTYGIEFASSVWRDNLFACQFHPEKSQHVGLHIIRNFARWS